MATRRIGWLFATVVAVSGAVPLGCNLLLGTGYVVGGTDAATHPDATSEGGVDAGPDSVAVDGSGASDGSDACLTSAQSKPQFESACTNGTCQPFDNGTRNTLCADGGTVCPQVPPYVPPDAGPPGDAGPPLDAGYPSCFALTKGPAGGTLPSTVVYATGSTAVQPYVARIAQVLESLDIEAVVYLGAGSCFGVGAMLSPATNTLQEIGTTATYYDPALDSNGNVQQGTCVVDDASRIADLGISDVFPTTCVPSLVAQGGLPNNLHDFFGPVQTMELVVPVSSTEESISDEAAYMVWGYGADSGVSPWTDPSYLLQRSGTSGTQNMIAAAIGLDPNEWQGVPGKTSGDVLAAITNVANGKGVDGGATADPKAAAKTLGILASDVADGNRQYLHPLAYQDVGQGCGWYPDTTVAAFDKRNVRDGHYPIWGPSHLVAYSDVNGTATNAAVSTLIDAMNGSNAQVLATIDVIAFYAKSHIVPTCAMHVQRQSDGHDYQPYAPATSCSCYYDLQATGQTSCVPCQSDAQCADAGAATTCVKVFGLPPAGYCEPPGTGQ